MPFFAVPTECLDKARTACQIVLEFCVNRIVDYDSQASQSAVTRNNFSIVIQCLCGKLLLFLPDCFIICSQSAICCIFVNENLKCSIGHKHIYYACFIIQIWPLQTLHCWDLFSKLLVHRDENFLLILFNKSYICCYFISCFKPYMKFYVYLLLAAKYQLQRSDIITFTAMIKSAKLPNIVKNKHSLGKFCKS